MRTNIFSRFPSQCTALASLVALGIAGWPAQAQLEGDRFGGGAIASQVAQASNTIVDVAAANNQFSTLVQALKAADLDDDLAGKGPFTVLAPTNAAFNELPDGTLDFLLKPENKDLLVDILKYHVVPYRVPADDLKTAPLNTLNGGLAVRRLPDRVVVNDGSITQPDIPASNGVIHGVNRVMIPPSVRDRLAAQQPVRGLW